jgi:hypothetical protein
MKNIYSIVLLLLLTSCVTSKITSNKAPDFNEKITKLFIVIKVTDNAKLFFSSFTIKLIASLKERGIELKTHYLRPLSLETEDDINEKIKAYSPNLTMIISQTESRQTVSRFGFGSTGTTTGGTFDVRIFQPSSKNPVWRANLSVDTSLGLETAAKRANEKLINKLTEDGLLNSI